MMRIKWRALRAAITLAVTAASLAAAAPASAGEYRVPFCMDHPFGTQNGWRSSETAGGTSGTPYFYTATNCGFGGYGFYRRFEVNTIAAGASQDLHWEAPAGTYVSRLYMSQDARPTTPGAADAIYGWLDNGTRNTIAIAVGGAGGSSLGSTTYVMPTSGAKTVRLQASMFCQGGGGNCAGVDANGNWGNVYQLWGGSVYLTDPSAPTVSAAGGEGWQSSPRDGEAPVTYTVADQGSGVKEIRLYVDGSMVDSDLSPCTPNASVPCPTSVSGTLTYDASRYSEGQHTIALVGVDASGNVMPQTAKQLAVTFLRAPESSTTAPPSASNPTVPGGSAPAPGDQLQGNPGTWTGSNLTFVYQWMRCDQNGQNCVPISGADGLNYTATSADVGRTLVFCVTASNSGGSTERCSAPSAVVVAQHPVTDSRPAGATTNDTPPQPVSPAGSTSGSGAGERVNLTAVLSSRTTVQKVRYGRKVPITGRLLRPDGTAIAGATLVVQTQTATPGAAMADAAKVVTGADGRFRWIAPAGPSRLVRFAYRSHVNDVSYVDTTDVRLLVMAGVTLKASPRKVRNKKATVFTGRVLGKPIAKRGVLVDLQVFYRKKWRTFAAPRTNRRGRYRFKYRFTAGAATWKFRARVRPGADYPYEQGLSRQRRVKVTR